MVELFIFSPPLGVNAIDSQLSQGLVAQESRPMIFFGKTIRLGLIFTYGARCRLSCTPKLVSALCSSVPLTRGYDAYQRGFWPEISGVECLNRQLKFYYCLHIPKAA